VEDLGDHADLGTGTGDRLADVFRLDSRELLAVLLDERGDTAEESGPVGRRECTPFRKNPAGPLDDRVGILDADLGQLGDRLLRGRVQDPGQRCSSR
jgi:hypothetical protein